MKKMLNRKFLGILVLVVAVFAIGVYCLHSIQVSRNAGAYLTQAERAEQEGDLDQAIEHLSRYLVLKPGDTTALAKYALLLADEKIATNARARSHAVDLLEQVLRRDPSRADVRRALIPLALRQGRHHEARPHLDILFQATPQDPHLEYFAGVCDEADGQLTNAADWYEKAINHSTDGKDKLIVDSYLRRSRLLRMRLNQPEEATKLVRRLLQVAPDNADAILAAAEQADGDKNWDEAKKLLERGIELHPRNGRMYIALALVERNSSGQQAEVAVLRRGLKAAAENQFDAVLFLADLLLDNREFQEVRTAMPRLERAYFPTAALNYLKARIDLAEGQWLQASLQLENARPHLIHWPIMLKKADFCLAQCYEQLGNPDQQLATSRRALQLDPLWPPAQRSLASALWATGRLDEALAEYRKLAAQDPALRLVLARLLIQRNLNLPAAERRWDEAEALLDEAAKSAADSLELPLLRADILIAKDKLPEARQLLVTAHEQHPRHIPFWLGLAVLADLTEGPDKALEILAQAHAQTGDSVELRLAQAGFLLKNKKPELSKALAELEKPSEQLSSEDRQRLRRLLADAYLRAGLTVDAGRLWNAIAKEQPDDLQCRLALFDLALGTGNDAEAQRLVADIRRLEGETGTLWRYAEAARIIRQKSPADRNASFAEAAKLLEDVAKRRPSWGKVALLQAELSGKQGDKDRALEHYQDAFKRGERGPDVIRPTLNLLYERRRYQEADALIRKLPEQAGLSGDFGRLAADLALRAHDPKRAVEMVQASAKSTDHRDHIWRGQVLWAADQKVEAEAAFRNAVKLAEQLPDAWLALVYFLAGTGQKDKALAAVEEAKQKVPAGEAPLMLASCWEVVGDLPKATEQFRTALAAKPSDPLVLRSATQFYLRHGQAPKAVELFRSMLDPKVALSEDARTWARRSLAVTLAATGNKGQIGEALTLVEQNLKAVGNNPEDQRAKAIVLAADPRRRGEALRLLEERHARQPLRPDDQFLLVQLIESLGDWPKARERMLTLLAAHENNPLYLAHYVAALLTRDDSAQAELWVAKLEKLEPEAWRTVDLKVRVLQAQGKKTAAADLLTNYSRKPDADIAFAATALDRLGEHAAAEELHRKNVAGSNRPESVLPLAQNLALQNRLPEAMELCNKAWEICPVEAVAITSMACLRATRPNQEQIQKVEQRLATALKQKPESLTLRLVLADLRDFQGRYADAIALHRQILQRDKDNVMALNNLAWLLILHGKDPTEALQLANRAIEAAGPNPSLLDTRGIAYLALEQTEPALKDLKEATAQSPNAVRLFHLARAHQSVKDRGTALKELQRAHTMGLKANTIHPLERPSLEKLQAALGAN
jgi:tetratricopeptide (TPR) repeat protein